VNRRGFFGLLGAVAASPKALKLVPRWPAIDIHRAVAGPSPFFGIDRTFSPPGITGIQGWLPEGVPMPGLVSPLAMQAFPESSLPTSPAGRLQWIQEMVQGSPILDDDGEPTGEYSEPCLTPEDAARLIDAAG
jgi:hypothetical protein